MIIINCDQGDSVWHNGRAGAITASMFSTVRKRLASGPNKGDFSKDAKDYAFRLAVERISGMALQDDQFETYAMRRGHELEPDARAEHERQAGVIVQRVGIVLTDDRCFGASADGKISEKRGCEYKCFLAPDKLRSILLCGDISECMDQIQGGMWITGAEEWDFALYCPALRPIGKQLWWRTVKRDDDYIYYLERDLMQFKYLVDEFEDTLRHQSPANAEQLQQAA